eukprot:128111_1
MGCEHSKEKTTELNAQHGKLSENMPPEQDAKIQTFTPGPHVVSLSHGVVIYKNWLTDAEQRATFDECMHLRTRVGNDTLRTPVEARTKWGAHSAYPVCFYNWPARPKSMVPAENPKNLMDVGAKLFSSAFTYSDPDVKAREMRVHHVERRAGSVCPVRKTGVDVSTTAGEAGAATTVNLVCQEEKEETKQDSETAPKLCAGACNLRTWTSQTFKSLSAPKEYCPDAFYAILYRKDGRFGSHLDGAKGWVVAVSVGCSAIFFYSSGRFGERSYIRLDSGDAVVFNGGQLHHGVSEILPETFEHSCVPEWWEGALAECGFPGYGRLNLQFRDSRRDTLTYDPQFPENGTGDC